MYLKFPVFKNHNRIILTSIIAVFAVLIVRHIFSDNRNNHRTVEGLANDDDDDDDEGMNNEMQIMNTVSKNSGAVEAMKLRLDAAEKAIEGLGAVKTDVDANAKKIDMISDHLQSSASEKIVKE